MFSTHTHKTQFPLNPSEKSKATPYHRRGSVFFFTFFGVGFHLFEILGWDFDPDFWKKVGFFIEFHEKGEILMEFHKKLGFWMRFQETMRFPVKFALCSIL